jgi:hypothetical protein
MRRNLIKREVHCAAVLSEFSTFVCVFLTISLLLFSFQFLFEYLLITMSYDSHVLFFFS